MQYQLPLIGTKWRGIQSVVENGKNGILVDIKSSNQISDSIEYMINHRDKLKEFGLNSRKKYLENYTINKYISNLENAFNSI